MYWYVNMFTTKICTKKLYLISTCTILINIADHACFLWQCSNLMLVESVPKEPLSFQVIPFDNPRGQHTLQVNMFFPCRLYIYYFLCYDSTACTYKTHTGSIPVIDLSCVFVLVQSKINWDISKASEQLGLNVLGFFNPISIKLNCKLNKWKPNDLNVEVSCFLLMYLNQTHLLIQLQCIVFVRSESWIWILECLKQKKIFLKMSGSILS